MRGTYSPRIRVVLRWGGAKKSVVKLVNGVAFGHELVGMRRGGSQGSGFVEVAAEAAFVLPGAVGLGVLLDAPVRGHRGRTKADDEAVSCQYQRLCQRNKARTPTLRKGAP